MTMSSEVLVFKITNTDNKVEILLRERAIDLYRIKAILDAGDWIDIKRHPKAPNQSIYIVAVDDYCWLVPVVNEDKTIKTAYPSRKFTKIYLET